MIIRNLFFGFVLCFFLQTNAQVWDFDGIDFSKADDIAAQNFGASLDNLPLLANSLTVDLNTEVERFRAIYIWVCNNVKNDYKLYYKNKRKRKRFEDDSLKLEKWNERFKTKIFSTLLRKKRTICSGYSYLLKTLCDLVDIKCQIIDGFGKTSTTTAYQLTAPNHSWNAVKLNNKWYLCDPTWASGVQNPKNGRFEFYYNDGLFLVPPKLFALGHYPADPKWLLISNNAPTFQDFYDAPILYGKTYSFLSSHDLPQKFFNKVPKNHELKIEVSLKPKIKPQNVVLNFDDGINISTVTPEVKIENNQLKINHTLKKYGYFDVHLLIDDNYVASYVYHVKRNLEEK